ncbi:TPA: biopolymer transporter ExbD [Aeromonas dhakensis]|nr:biopolymer transporter ExbD [Aeromonas dhakensis]
MAFGKLSDEGDDQPLSEINMIPMIDVMLVLLIVFMITAPLLTNAVKLELPEASSQPDKQDINLAIDEAGKLYWNDQEVDEAALLARMESAGQAEGELPEIQLRIDRKVEYGIIARVMAQASRHGLHKIAFVSQPDP